MEHAEDYSIYKTCVFFSFTKDTHQYKCALSLDQSQRQKYQLKRQTSISPSNKLAPTMFRPSKILVIVELNGLQQVPYISPLNRFLTMGGWNARPPNYLSMYKPNLGHQSLTCSVHAALYLLSQHCHIIQQSSSIILNN